MAQLVERATPLSRAAIEIARVAEQRAIALYPKQTQTKNV